MCEARGGELRVAGGGQGAHLGAGAAAARARAAALECAAARPVAQLAGVPRTDSQATFVCHDDACEEEAVLGGRGGSSGERSAGLCSSPLLVAGCHLRGLDEAEHLQPIDHLLAMGCTEEEEAPTHTEELSFGGAVGLVSAVLETFAQLGQWLMGDDLQAGDNDPAWQ